MSALKKGSQFHSKTFLIPADGKVNRFSFTYTAPANTIIMSYYCIDAATPDED